jgi:hypothetical protein
MMWDVVPLVVVAGFMVVLSSAAKPQLEKEGARTQRTLAEAPRSAL